VEVVVAQAVRLRIFANDPDRARAFYARVFGWSLPKGRRCCWVITSGDDPRLSIDDSDEIHDHHVGEVLLPTIHVANLDAATAAALAAGGEVLVPRIPVPGAGWLVYLADTEDNVIGIMQDDPDAAWPQAPANDAPGPRAGRAKDGRGPSGPGGGT
jgi:predicted enzyme related to lactoylglutathione lyase